MPVFVINVGMFLMSLVDSLMLSYTNAEHLGLQSLGDTPVSIVLMILSGLVQGVLFTASAAHGQGKPEVAGQAFRQALGQAGLLAFVAIPVYFSAPYVMSLFDYTPEQTKSASLVMRILSCSIPFSAVYYVCSYFLNGIKQPWITTRFVLVANIINFAADWLLVTGHFGIEPLYSAGVAYSTTIVRAFLGIGLVSYILYAKRFAVYKIREKSQGEAVTMQRRLGYGATANMLSAELGFAFCMFFAGSISVMVAAGYTLAYRVMFLTHLISVSFAVAGSVISGEYVGKDKQALRAVYVATVTFNNFVMLPICIAIAIFPQAFTAMLTNDAELLALTYPMMQIMTAAMWLRGLNSIQIILLRTIHDLFWPSVWYGAGFVLIMPLLCQVLSLSLEQGKGVVCAIVAANLFIVLYLEWRHRVVTKS